MKIELIWKLSIFGKVCKVFTSEEKEKEEEEEEEEQEVEGEEEMFISFCELFFFSRLS